MDMAINPDSIDQNYLIVTFNVERKECIQSTILKLPQCQCLRQARYRSQLATSRFRKSSPEGDLQFSNLKSTLVFNFLKNNNFSEVSG